ncbi:MAG: hypothetical protein ACP5R4_12410 [Armatimonadota bacterium]
MRFDAVYSLVHREIIWLTRDRLALAVLLFFGPLCFALWNVYRGAPEHSAPVGIVSAGLLTSLLCAARAVCDRRSGWMSVVLASPAGKSAVVAAPIAAAALVCAVQTCEVVFLHSLANRFAASISLARWQVGLVEWALELVSGAVFAASMCALWMVAGWYSASVLGFVLFGVVASLIGTAGALCAASAGLPRLLSAVNWINPVWFGFNAARRALDASGWMEEWLVCVAVLCAIAAVCANVYAHKLGGPLTESGG